MSKTGWAVISVTDRQPTVIDAGFIKTNPKDKDGLRLKDVHDGINAVIEYYYANLSKEIAIEESLVQFRTATKQIMKARGVLDFSLNNYDMFEVNNSTVKAWAKRRVGGGKKFKVEKAHVYEAVEGVYGNDIYGWCHTRKGKLLDDVSDAVAVGTVYLIKKELIDLDE